MTKTPQPGNDDLMKAIQDLSDQVAELTDEIRRVKAEVQLTGTR